MGRLARRGARPGKTRRARPLRRRQPVLSQRIAAGDAAAAAPAGEPWHAWCDGTAWPNPGRIGVGVVLVSPRGERLELARTLGNGCNNEAELHALQLALEHAGALGARALRVHSDSDFVVRHVGGEQRTAVARLHTLIERTQTLLAGFDSVELRWLPRHRNRDADRLARGALGLPDKPAAVPGRDAGRRKNRQKR